MSTQYYHLLVAFVRLTKTASSLNGQPYLLLCLFLELMHYSVIRCQTNDLGGGLQPNE